MSIPMRRPTARAQGAAPAPCGRSPRHHLGPADGQHGIERHGGAHRLVATRAHGRRTSGLYAMHAWQGRVVRRHSRIVFKVQRRETGGALSRARPSRGGRLVEGPGPSRGGILRVGGYFHRGCFGDLGPERPSAAEDRAEWIRHGLAGMRALIWKMRVLAASIGCKVDHKTLVAAAQRDGQKGLTKILRGLEQSSGRASSRRSASVRPQASSVLPRPPRFRFAPAHEACR